MQTSPSGLTRRLLSLAWPVFIGQLAVMLNGVIDTVMAARLGTTDLAAVGLGASIYITVYVSFMGVLLALQPTVAQHFGARRFDAIGRSFMAGLWLVPLLSAPGCLALAWTSPWIAASQPPAAVADITREYLWAVAFGLPAALFFRVFYAFNTAVARPKVVMTLNLIGVALKIPLNAWFMQGGLGLPAMGGAGCGAATSAIMWLLLGLAVLWLKFDPWYQQFRLFEDLRLRWSEAREVLRLGVPIAIGYGVEVASFTFMALFLARQGELTAASHQIAANLTGVCYMVALGLSSACSVLVAQSIGAQDLSQARQVLRRGWRVAWLAGAVVASLVVLLREPIARTYTSDPALIAATVALLPWVAGYHFFDAIQTFLVYQLRAFKVTAWPMIIYFIALWGIGLGGGWWLTFDSSSAASALQVIGLRQSNLGAAGFWTAGMVSLAIASIALAAVFLAKLKTAFA
jgi:multidrug resistance protein, MATE family